VAATERSNNKPVAIDAGVMDYIIAGQWWQKATINQEKA